MDVEVERHAPFVLHELPRPGHGGSATWCGTWERRTQHLVLVVLCSEEERPSDSCKLAAAAKAAESKKKQCARTVRNHTMFGFSAREVAAAAGATSADAQASGSRSIPSLAASAVPTATAGMAWQAASRCAAVPAYIRYACYCGGGC